MTTLLCELLLLVKGGCNSLSRGPFMTPFVQGSQMEGKQNQNMKRLLIYSHHPDPWLAFCLFYFHLPPHKSKGNQQENYNMEHLLGSLSQSPLICVSSHKAAVEKVTSTKPSFTPLILGYSYLLP